MEEVTVSKQKLLKRVSELKEELQRETKLASSLEESQSSLLKRVKDMENQVESERQQVKSD